MGRPLFLTDVSCGASALLTRTTTVASGAPTRVRVSGVNGTSPATDRREAT
jgi:hypothetical protein